jgi:hypothetical protein
MNIEIEELRDFLIPKFLNTLIPKFPRGAPVETQDISTRR